MNSKKISKKEFDKYISTKYYNDTHKLYNDYKKMYLAYLYDTDKINEYTSEVLDDWKRYVRVYNGSCRLSKFF